jgi:hypothetical protein
VIFRYSLGFINFMIPVDLNEASCYMGLPPAIFFLLLLLLLLLPFWQAVTSLPGTRYFETTLAIVVLLD